MKKVVVRNHTFENSHNKLLAVFTPAYNRADTLARTYESLQRQSSKNFKWIIVDDGSTDNTEEIVREWLVEEKMPILYVKKVNGGLVTGYNTALEYIDTELNVCIDSDDYMPDNAVEIIEREWAKIADKDIAGLVGLDYKESGKPIGGLFSLVGDYFFPEKFSVIKHMCDCKIVCRTSLMKEIAPLPTYGEKHFNPIMFYHKIGESKKFRFINENLCIVEYLPDGMMAGLYRQYKNSPKSFAEMRKVRMSSKYSSRKAKLKSAIHYVSSSIFSRNIHFIQESPKPLLTLAAVPFGCVLHLIVLYKLWKERDKNIKV